MAVLDVTDANLQETLQTNQRVVVKYFADWCGSCRLFKPKFKRLSDDERFGGIAFANVNAEHNPEARKLANVANLPFFAIFENGQFVEGVSTNQEPAVVELIAKLTVNAN